MFLLPLLLQSAAADIVVTATRAQQSPGEIGQAVTVLDRETIELRQTVSVADLLAQTPGVTISRNGGPGTFSTVRIRGAEGEQTLVLIDGVRINDPSSPGGGFDFGNLLNDSFERIEVVRGPNSVPWGTQALGGVVNIITARPARGFELRARGEGGSFGTGQATASVAGTAGPVAASIAGGYFRTDGVSAAEVGTERDGYRRVGANGRVEVALPAGLSLDLRGYFSRGRTELDGFRPDFTFGDTAGIQRTRELIGYAGLNGRWWDGRFNNRLAFTITDVDRENANPGFTADGRVERYEYQGDVRASDAIRLVFGAEAERSRFADGVATFRTGIDSAYGQAILSPVTGLTLTGGVRYDDHRNFGGNTSLAANGAWVLGSTTLRASFAEGFKAPTLFQLRSGFGNPALEPETARNFDLGVERRLGDRLTASLTGFRRRTRNQIDFVSCRADIAICAGGARPFGTYDNIARARAAGVEAALDWRPVDALTFAAAYSYIDAENRTPGANFGRDLLRRPKHSLALNADARTGFGLSLGGTLRVVSSSADADFSGRVRLGGYELLDLRASYAATEAVELYGRVENVTDADYQTVLGYGTPGRAAYAGLRARF